MKLLLGAKRYLEELELKKKKEMEPEDHEEENNFTVAEQKTLEMKLLVSVVLHPLDYAKNLIMMGYEPLPPYQSYWFGKPYYLYPNVLKYVRHIYSVDGVLGCFRGIVCKSSALVVQNTLITYFDKKYPAPQIGDSLQSKLKRNIVVKCICTLASHPLQMMAVRCMAQFVGRERLYSEWNPLANLLTILKLEGLAGLFKGFWAKLLGEVALVTASVVIVHSIHRMIKSNSDSDNSEKSMVFVSTVVNFACVSYFYPYNVVSTTMSVNGAGLSIGQPPMSPIFANTHHCYTYLSYMNQLKRGSNLFYRWVPTVSRSDDILKLRSA
ncbi:mitochondrial carrier homolog 1-like isoform X1 [Diaphorina citri]|uniref:Mitochondrial carrier homolog 1-like isoform X1 n=2 Tax=Diaphorina citri TaxID=121845 RepID=A0A3Q0IQ65_DIACI|nr:mitochondrial carrier homolog 1-like isoform X1 [Diaphorina citri]KAI5734478.1 hypothetical protein M8J77_006956 [Diaphorina citri]